MHLLKLVDNKIKKGKNIMKKLLILGMSSMFAFSAAAQTLEERVEALEYAGYENYTKVGGRLEYRFDSYTREIKDDYTVVNTNTNSGEARSTGKQAAGYQRVFLNLNISSIPSDKLSFYGKLSMAKYVNHFNTDGGTSPEDSAFNDLSRGISASSSSLFVERAFANYAFSKNLTLTFGRLPTSHGAPRQFSSNEAKKGNYPVLSFGGNWDGMALSYGLESGHAFKLVYTPVSSVPFNGQMLDGLSDSSGDKVDVNSPAYALIYEFDKANFAGSRNFYFTATYFTVKDMPTLPSSTGSNLYLSLDRTSFYSEFSGIKGSNFDVYLHGVSTVTKSKGGLTGVGGWLTSSTDSDTKNGTAMGFGAKYSLNSKIKLGLEYFTGSEDAFLYDSANQDAASIYTTYGNAQHLFYSHSFEGGLDIVLGHIIRNSDTTRKAFNLIGASSDIDNIETNTYAKFISKF
ncbi:MAG: hypothetical protein ACJAS4_001335 [Bacteriovoracaceae bacterium]|jgi:hypothetical protein